MEADLNVRDLKWDEIVHLERFLYDAIYIPPGSAKPDKLIIKIPELITYIKDFGKDSDLCLVAEINGKLIGAIWAREFPENERGFAYVDDKTPELSMSVDENHRNSGIGTKLMIKMIERLKNLNYEQVSLSVNKLNYAFRMYLKFGFEEVRSDETSAIMVKKLK